MSWLRGCDHHWEIITVSYDKDYEHPDCYNDYGNQIYKNVYDEESRHWVKQYWGKHVTVFTLQCDKCGDVKSKTIDGWQEYVCDKEHVKENILKPKDLHKDPKKTTWN